MPPYFNQPLYDVNDPVPSVNQIQYVGRHFHSFLNDPRASLWRREQQRQFEEDFLGRPLWEVDDLLNSGFWDDLSYNQAVLILNEYADHRRSLTGMGNVRRSDVRRAQRQGEDKENQEPPPEQHNVIFV